MNFWRRFSWTSVIILSFSILAGLFIHIRYPEVFHLISAITTHSTLNSLLIGILGSVIGSIMTVYFLYRLQPELQLSDKIARTTYGGKTVYAFKVVNIGNRPAFSIMAEAYIIEPQVIYGGIGYNFLRIQLQQSDVFVLWPLSKVRERPGDVFEFITEEDLDTEWGEFHQNSYILFQVKAQDGFSGFYKIFKSEFYSKKDIRTGRFAKGRSMEVVEVTRPQSGIKKVDH